MAKKLIIHVLCVSRPDACSYVEVKAWKYMYVMSNVTVLSICGLWYKKHHQVEVSFNMNASIELHIFCLL